MYENYITVKSSADSADQTGKANAQERIYNLQATIDQLRRENDELRASVSRGNEIMDALPAMVGYVDLDQRIVFANKQMEYWYKLKREDLIGMQLKTLFSRKHYETVEPLLEQVLSGTEVNDETTITYADEVCRDVHLNYIPHVDDGNVLGYFFLVRDISLRKRAECLLKGYNEELDRRVQQATAELKAKNQELRNEIHNRKRAEENLRANQEWLSEALESMSDGFLLFDSEGRLVAHNPKVKELFPSTAKAIKRGTSFEKLLRVSAEAGEVKEAIGRIDEWVEERMRWYPSESGSQEVQLSDGRWILATDRPTRAGGVVGLRRDITERKQAEEKLRSQEAEMASVLRRASMGEMASALAHELGQPLAAIVNYTKGSLYRLNNHRDMHALKIPTEIIDALERVCHESERAKAIIRHVSDFVRQSSPKVEPHDIKEILNSVFELTDASMKRNGIKKSLSLPKEKLIVLVNRIEIEQVLFNLIRNCVDALKDKTSNNRVVNLSCQLSASQECEITIGDNGPGISETIANRVFEPYVTTKQSGLGMGLSISRTIVESHGGRLQLLETSDQGSCFRFNLPDAYTKLMH